MKEEQKNISLGELGIPEGQSEDCCRSDDGADLNLSGIIMKMNVDATRKFANSTKEQFEKLYKVCKTIDYIYFADDDKVPYIMQYNSTKNP